jgi:GNAT superfamily N-acetyltransferase
MSKFAKYIPKSSESARLPSIDGFLIRPAYRSDLSAIAAIAAEREGEAVDRWVAAFERIYLESEAGRAVIFVAALGADIAGYGKTAYFIPPENSATNVAPEGWYLAGVVVRLLYRRRGLGRQLTQARLDWIAERAVRAYYFSNERNQVSIDLHRPLGFVELTRDFYHPEVRFTGGAGVLFVCELRPGRSD